MVSGVFGNGLSRGGDECSSHGTRMVGQPRSISRIPSSCGTDRDLSFFEDNGFASSGDLLLVFLACTYHTSCWSGWSTNAPSVACPYRALCCCNKYLPIRQPEVLLPGFSVCVPRCVYIRHADRSLPSEVDLLESENRSWTLHFLHVLVHPMGKVQALLHSL